MVRKTTDTAPAESAPDALSEARKTFQAAVTAYQGARQRLDQIRERRQTAAQRAADRGQEYARAKQTAQAALAAFVDGSGTEGAYTDALEVVEKARISMKAAEDVRKEMEAFTAKVEKAPEDRFYELQDATYRFGLALGDHLAGKEIAALQGLLPVAMAAWNWANRREPDPDGGMQSVLEAQFPQFLAELFHVPEKASYLIAWDRLMVEHIEPAMVEPEPAT